MKKKIICLLSGILLVLAVNLCQAGPGDGASRMVPMSIALGQAGSVKTTEMKLRVFEGIRAGGRVEAAAVTSSYLKYSLSMNIEIEGDLAAEQQRIRKVFNLDDVKLLTEADLAWTKSGSDPAFHIFRINGEEYLVRVARGKSVRQFQVHVWEQGEGDTEELLDMRITIPAKNSAVFGFEDTQGKPYFLLLRVTGVGGVMGGVVGGVAGGVVGGVGGGVAGRIQAPKIVRQVDPVYPPDARKERIEGAVVLEGTTDIYGRVAKVKVLKSIPALDQAAIEALKKWIYEPIVIDGKPRPVVFTVTMRFKLEESAGKIERAEAADVITGGVSGGVVGGVKGGVAGGVEGGVDTGIQARDDQKFETGAVRAIGEIKPPRLIKEVAPKYPEVARQAKVEGVVILEVGTDEMGTVAHTRILRSIPLLDQAAVDAVKQWKYEPFILEGTPRKILFTVTVAFKLKEVEFASDAIKAVGEIKPPKLIKSVEPVYPEAARQAGVQGVVILSVKTDVNGRVADTKILRSIPLLDQAAIDAVKQWIYEPLIIEGEARPVVFTVTVRFNLK